jgi:hypothetical protein
MPPTATSKFLFLLETQGLVHSLFFGMLDFQTLASVAQVSPFFEAAAVEVLYRSLDGFWPLLRLMPINAQDHPRNGFVSVGAPTLHLVLPCRNIQDLLEISPEQWVRYARIAKRVRHVDWLEDASTMCAMCLEIASRQMHDKMPASLTSLLPNLQSFHAHCASEQGLQASLPWLSPSLEHLALSVRAEVSAGEILSFLTHAWAVCSEVKSFALRIGKMLSSSDGLELSCRLAESMAILDLATLTIPLDLVSDCLLDTVSASGRLQYLILSRSSSTLPPRTLRSQDTAHTLHHLSLQGFMADVIEVVTAAGNAVQTIHIQALPLRDASEMRLALRAIVNSCPQLRDLSIHFEDINLQENQSWMDLSALLRCHTLERLVIQHPCPLPISNTLLTAMIHAWPYARFVSLNPRPPLGPWTPGWDILPTSSCLVAVAQMGCKLRHFGIYLKGDGGNMMLDGISPTGETLEELDLGWTEMGPIDGRNVKAFITRLFPNAKAIID